MNVGLRVQIGHRQTVTSAHVMVSCTSWFGQNRSFVTPPISVLFGAANIPVKEGAKEKRLEQRRDTILEKRRKAVEQHKAQDPRDDATLEGE
jgi:hypothetical protein